MASFLKTAQVREAAAAAAAGTSTVVGSIYDASGFGNSIFWARIDTANAGNYIKVEQGDDSGLSDAEDLLDVGVVPSANGELAIIEIISPTKRYLRPSIVRGVSTSTGPINCIQTGAAGSQLVENNVAGVAVAEVHEKPAAGAAV